MRKVTLVLLVLFFLISAAYADYLEIRRTVQAKKSPAGDAVPVFSAELGSYLQLLEEETQNGYYHVQNPKTGAKGWIYRSFVRRYSGQSTAR